MTTTSTLPEPKATVKTGILLVHGANMVLTAISVLESDLSRKIAKVFPELHQLAIPRWRQKAGFTLGAIGLTVRESTKDSTIGFAWQAALQSIARGALRPGLTAAAEKQRAGILGEEGQFLGDVMAYNCHRAAIHDVIRQELAAMDVDYILAVGHSLGGIILVDLMAEEPNSKVGAVVTVGSQAALMYGLDAMVGLRYNSGRPFTPWLNVWDPLDLLSFEAHQVFRLRRGAENARPILDVQVDSCEAFPGSHSAYWNQEGTWAAMMLGLQYCVDRHREIPEGSTKGDDIVQLLKSRVARDVEFTLQTTRAQSQALTPLLAQHSVSLAQAALKQIEGKTAAMRQVERTNAQYYRLPFGNYAVVPGKIDTRCARKIIKMYASLRPRDWTQGHQWLGLIADHEALTDEAELILRSKGIGVYYRSRSA